MIYLDNAATSFPKPDSVWDAVLLSGKSKAGNPGRSGHRLAAEAAREVFAAREAVARFFKAGGSSRIIFTANATMALNTALYGFLQTGDHVVTSSMEHNSVLRPLHALQQSGRITYTIVPCNPRGELDPDDIKIAVRPATRLIALTHASNVCGTILPIEEVKRLFPEIPILVDAAQTAGVLPIDIQKAEMDMLVFSGHKGLFGPMGTGGLYVSPAIELKPLVQGGTGSRSESPDQPDFLPDALEAGTLNVPGLCGLRAGIEFIEAMDLEIIRAKEVGLTKLLLEALVENKKIKIHGVRDPARQTAVVAVTVGDRDPAEIAYQLDRKFDIACRAGLHCAPEAHRTLGTFPAGAVRFSMSWFNTEEDIDALFRALQEIN